MIGIAWRTLRRDAGTLFGAFLMVAVGAALITAFAIVQESVDGTRAPVERYAGTDVVASGGSGSFSASLLDEIESAEGVDTAVPELNSNATLLDSDGGPVLDQEDTAQFAHSWSSAALTPFTVDEGSEPAAAGQVAIDAALAERAGVGVGETVRVEIGGLDHEFELSGTVEPTDGPMEHQHALFLQPEQAEELADRGGNRYDAIGIGLVPGADHAEIDSLLVLDRVLAQGYTPPQNWRTTEATYGGEDTDTRRPNRNAATVHVEYDLDGTTHTAHVQVAREDTGWLRDWEITSPGTLLGGLVVTSDHLDEVRVAAAEIDTVPTGSETHTSAAVPALPGTYELATTDEETLFAGADPLGEVTVLGPSATPATIAELVAEDLTVREGPVAEVADQIEAHLDECAQAETLTPTECPLRLENTPTRSTDEVSWEISEMPEIDLAASDEEVLHGAPLEVETTTPGTAEAEWTYAYTDDEETQDETVEVTVGVTVTVDEGGAPVWSP